MCPVKESNLESSLLPDLYYMLGRLDIREYVKQSERLISYQMEYFFETV